VTGSMTSEREGIVALVKIIPTNNDDPSILEPVDEPLEHLAKEQW
jgi:hypothetical protein